MRIVPATKLGARSLARGTNLNVRSHERPENPELMISPSILSRAAAVLLLLIVVMGWSASESQAQSALEWDGGREQMTRTELNELRVRLEEAVASTAYSASLRREAERNLEVIRLRLEQGDFQVGDRIALSVEGEEELSDTLTVRLGPSVNVPVVGSISLQGILRSELEPHLTSEIGRYVREPRVEARALIRVLVQGEVETPGFLLMPAETLISDLISLAGGPTGAANLSEMRIERGGDRIWEGEAMESAVIQGRTLDQMNLQAGDRVFVPERVDRDGTEWLRIVGYTVAPIVSIVVALTAIF
jgi:polysaccharide biosynthesis/export protein